MNKALIEVDVPALDKSFDVLVSQGLSLSQIIELLKKSVYELSEGNFIPDKNIVLLNKDSGGICKDTIENPCVLHNGMRFVLF